MEIPKIIFTLKDLIGGKKGSIELSALFFYFMIFSLCLFVNQKVVLWNTELKQRSNSLLCFKESMDKHAKILKRVGISNKLILAANATFLITHNPISLQTKKATQLAQKILISSYLFSLSTQKQCSPQQKLLLARYTPIHLPFRRDTSGRVILRKFKSSLIFPLTFSPIKGSYLFGKVSLAKKLTFSSAKEVAFI